jgi:hypothetical protein
VSHSLLTVASLPAWLPCSAENWCAASAAAPMPLKLYVGGLPEKPMPPFHYQLVFSVEGLINEYVEPARILRKGKLVTIEPLTEPEEFHMPGLRPSLPSTPPAALESFEGRVGECFELKALGLFSGDKMRINGAEIVPRAVMSEIFEGKFAGKGADVCIMRLEAHESVRSPGVRSLLGGRLKGRVATFTLVDHYDPKTDMSTMMRTIAFPALIVTQMIASGALTTRRRAAGTGRPRRPVSGRDVQTCIPHPVQPGVNRAQNAVRSAAEESFEERVHLSQARVDLTPHPS